MSWLRLDDSTRSHPKVLELTRADRWRWVDLLLQVAHRHYDTGHATPGMLRAADISRRLRAQLLDVGLLDEQPDGTLTIHDWHTYNPKRDPTGRDRQARYRARTSAQRDGKAIPSWATIVPQQRDTPPQEPSDIPPQRNALRDASPVTGVTSPTPTPSTNPPPKPPTDTPPSGRRRASSGRAGRLETIGTSAEDELRRLRGLAGDAPSWPLDEPSEGDAAA